MSNNNEFLKGLINKGWKNDPVHGWHKPSSRLLGGIQIAEHQCHPRRPAEGSDRRKEKGPRSVVKRTGQQSGVHVSIIFVRERLFDDDNSTAGGKWLRDAIASSLGIDDSEIQWSYSQIKCGELETPGTLVKITLP
jgi:hypothetical protein